MAKQVMPEAELEPRPSDIPLTEEQFLKIGLFARLKRKPSLDKFPGAMVLRRYRKGEVIFRQGEAGWTAFYILTSEDLLAIEGKEKCPEEKEIFRTLGPEEIETLFERLEQLQQTPARDEELRTVATVNLAIARPPELQEGWWRRLQHRVFGDRTERRERPLYIPIDGPRDIDYQTLQSSLGEGELFGEMSCLYRRPRSATVVAARDCYMLEMLRNILDQLQKDPAYKAQTDELYKKRVFELHVRQLSLFRDLTSEQFEEFRKGLDLVIYEPGQLIFDEHERPDSMYIIRSGLVRVVKKVSALLSADNVRSWKSLIAALREGEQQPAGPRGKIWQLLSEKTRTLLCNIGNTAEPPDADRLEVLFALNDILKERTLADAKEFQDLVNGDACRARADEFPSKKRKDWSDLDLRRFNRLLLEAIYAGILRTHRRRVGPDCVLSYCSRGEVIGEMALLGQQPRSATCIAYGHPQEDGQGKESGRVELIRIPRAVFERLTEVRPDLRARLEKEMAERQRRTQKVLAAAIWDDSQQVMHSPRFEELGLIQGQKLMLIDLDRCTRCDECVKACVNTHDDGRSRLFLDGPRFDRYLVPTTCRSCLDPVCMVGCPVGSIHRGNNGQIEIEDWCIGCGLCANNCPYGSIQMHDIGIIPSGARSWKFRRAEAAGTDQWHLRRFNDSEWTIGNAPFYLDRQFLSQLEASEKATEREAGRARGRAIYFRLEFRLASYLVKPDSQFKVELTSMDAAATVWINGHEIKPDKPKAGKREYSLPPKVSPPAAAAGPQPAVPTVTQLFRSGRNVVAVRVTLGSKSQDVLLDLRLDSIHKPVGAAAGEEVTEKLVTERAVVCDLCSSLPGQVPSCVNACPHDAAMRVDARFEFPVK
jgi:CRP-like cAMP-binding protein/Fe-S-cluster-containing hydrogenase component 2